MTDLRTEIQSAIMDHIHEVRGVAALTDAIMGVVEKQSDDVHLWRFWNEKARELASSNDSLRQQLADERNKALEDAASVLENCNVNGLERRICCNGYMCGCHGSTVAEYAAHCVRAMKDKP